MKYCTYTIKGKRMKTLMVIGLFIGLFTQSTFAKYRGSALEARCEYGQVNGKYVESSWDPKVCLRAIHAVANDKSITPRYRYRQAKSIAEKVCRRYGGGTKYTSGTRSTPEGRKACQLEKYYWKKFQQHNKSRPDRKW